MDVIETTPDRERAKSLLDMVSVRMETIKLLKDGGSEKFTPMIIEEYYESLLELVTAIMCIDGYKTRSDAAGAHTSSINYIKKYGEMRGYEIELINEMRKKRAGIKYYGRSVSDDYLRRKESQIKRIIRKLESITEKKLRGST